MRISTRVSLGVSALALLVFGAIAAWQVGVERRDLYHAVERELMLTGRAMRVSTENALRDRQIQDVELTVSALEQIQPDVDVVLFAPDGAVRAASAGASEALKHIDPRLSAGPPADPPRVAFDRDYAVLLVPLTTDHPLGALAILRPLADVDLDLASEASSLAVAVLAFSALVGALVYGLGEVLVGRPLARLSAAMARVGGGDFDIRLDTTRDDEIGRVAADFATMLGELGRARASLVSEQDAHRLAQRALQDADRLVTVGQLSAGLAHEIGSPLQVLHGRARRLLKQADDPGAVRQDAEVIAGQAERITRIVQQLLDVARRRPRHERDDPRAAVRAVVELLEFEARRKGVALALVVEADLPVVSVESDPLQQIALNLARNALQASSAGGRVTLTLTRGEVTRAALGSPAPSLRLIVDDRGAGVAPEVRPRLFEPFFTTRGASGGTGLGLAIVQTIVQELGGTIEVASEVGHGSRFVVDLPLAAVTGLTAPAQALQEISQAEYDLVIADVEMPGMRGPELMAAIHARRPVQLVLLVTAFGSIELATRAVREGACDFLAKPFTIEALVHAIERALRERQLRREIVRLRRRVERDEDDSLVAESAAMRRVVDLARRAALTSSTVLLTGESGVGKGAVAAFLHRQSGRKRFIQINCAALPAPLIESELFGVRRGAFTDAREDRPGLLVEADGGTLLLDEIGELPTEVQAKLLHALETHRVRPLGGTTDTKVDVRLVAATNRPLEADVRTGRFRADLYHRINVIRIAIPPLRERREDILPLIDRMLPRLCERVRGTTLGLSAPALRWLLEYDWPGNVRELAHLLERAVALAEHDSILIEDIRADSVASESADDSLAEAAQRGASLAEVEAAYVARVLERVDGNKAQAARILGIDRRTLYRKLGASEDGG